MTLHRRALGLLIAALLYSNGMFAESIEDLFLVPDPRPTRGLEDKPGDFGRHQLQMLSEFAEYQKIYDEERQRFEAEVAAVWNDAKQSDRERWVSYNNNNQQRTEVDFESGTVKIEQIVPAGKSPEKVASKQNLKAELSALVTKTFAEAYREDTLATRVEARAVAELKDAVYSEPAPATPVLAGLVTDSTRRKDLNKAVTQMADTREVDTRRNDRGETIVTNIVKLPRTTFAKGLPRRAQPYAALIENQAESLTLPAPLVYAITETESAFNPMARSHVPAFGLMQIVPASGGADASRVIFGKSRILSPQYLYNPENNVKVGAVYINMILTRYFDKISDPLSRLYCSIVAYNAGIGTVAAAFTGKPKLNSELWAAVDAMTPDEVYEHIVNSRDLNSEARNYLKRVVSNKDKFASALAGVDS